MTQEIKIVGGTPQTTTFGQIGAETVVDATFGSARVSLRPQEFLSPQFQGGHYRAAQVSGALTGAAAASAVFSMRWGLAGSLFVLKRLQVGYVITTAFTTGQILDFDVVRCTGFTAADTGGTALTPFTGNNNKKRSALVSTAQVADMRIASTAALGAGTKTQDTNPFGYISAIPINLATPTATVPGGYLSPTDIYAENTNGEHAEVFGNNEGFNVRVVTALGAAGVIKLYVVVDWAEVPNI